MDHYVLKIERSGSTDEVDLGPKIVQVGSDPCCDVVLARAGIRPVHFTIQPQYIVRSAFDLYARGQATKEAVLGESGLVGLDANHEVVVRLGVRLATEIRHAVSIGVAPVPRDATESVVATVVGTGDGRTQTVLMKRGQTPNEILQLALDDLVSAVRRRGGPAQRSSPVDNGRVAALEAEKNKLENQLEMERAARRADKAAHERALSSAAVAPVAASNGGTTDVARAELEARLAAVTAERDAASKRASELEAKLKETTSILDATRGALLSIEAKSKDQANEIARLSTHVEPAVHSAVVDEAAKLRSRLEEASKEVETLRGQNHELEKLRSETRRLSEASTERESRLRDAIVKNGLLREQIQTLAITLSRRDSVEEARSRDVVEAHAETAGLKVELEKLRIEKQRLEARVETAERQIEPAYRELLASVFSKSALEVEISALRQSLEDATSRPDAATPRIAELEAAAERVAGEKATLEKDLASARRELEGMRREADGLRAAKAVAPTSVAPPPAKPIDKKWIAVFTDAAGAFLNVASDMVLEAQKRDASFPTRRVHGHVQQAVAELTKIFDDGIDGSLSGDGRRIREWFEGAERRLRADVGRNLAAFTANRVTAFGRLLRDRFNAALSPEVILKATPSSGILSSRESRCWETYKNEHQRFNGDFENLLAKLSTESSETAPN